MLIIWSLLLFPNLKCHCFLLWKHHLSQIIYPLFSKKSSTILSPHLGSLNARCPKVLHDLFTYLSPTHFVCLSLTATFSGLLHWTVTYHMTFSNVVHLLFLKLFWNNKDVDNSFSIITSLLIKSVIYIYVILHLRNINFERNKLEN